MKTKYTLQELIDKKLAIKLDTEEQYEFIKKMACESKIRHFDIFTFPDGINNKPWTYYAFRDGELQLSKEEHLSGQTIIPASEFFIETPEDRNLQVEIKGGLGTDKSPLKLETHTLHEVKDEDIITVPMVVNKASEAFSRFLEQWNALKEKAMQIKTVKSLDTLTDKIKELK